MDCPSCKNELNLFYYHGIEVNQCPNCGGIWFDKGEFRDYISQYYIDHRNIPYNKIEYKKYIVGEENFGQHLISCPLCQHLMNAVNYGYDSNIIVDRCPKCQGIWIERNQLLPLAIYIKGNPKLDNLGKALANDAKYKENIKDLLEIGDTLTKSAVAIPAIPILPLGLNFRSKTIPYMTIGIILINIIVFLYEIFGVDNLNFLFQQYGFIPAVIFDKGEYYRFITSIFLHVNILHIISNLLFLWIFSDNVEDYVGHFLYLFLYLIFGIAGGFLTYFTMTDIHSVSIGASGAISGVMGAFLVFYPSAKIKTLLVINTVNIPAIIYIGSWFIFQLIYGLLTYSSYIDTHIGWFAHLGGFFAGIIIAIIYKGLVKITRAS